MRAKSNPDLSGLPIARTLQLVGAAAKIFEHAMPAQKRRVGEECGLGRLIALVAWASFLSAPGQSQSPVETPATAGGGDLQARVRDAVERVMTVPAGSDRREVRLIDLGLSSGRLTLNWSRHSLTTAPAVLSSSIGRAAFMGDWRCASDRYERTSLHAHRWSALHGLLDDERSVAGGGAAPPAESQWWRRRCGAASRSAGTQGVFEQQHRFQRPMLFGIVDYVNWDIVSTSTRRSGVRPMGADAISTVSGRGRAASEVGRRPLPSQGDRR